PRLEGNPRRLRLPGSDRRLPEDGALSGRRRSGERGLRDLDERDDHRRSKPRRQAQGLVRHGERQQGNAPGNPLWGDGWGWSWFDADKPLKTTSTDYHTDCQGCHVPAKATVWIYVNGYPVLRY